MTELSTEMWAILALVLLIGLFAGLIFGSSPKWKRRYREEHARREALERDHEAYRHEQETRIRAANARIAELAPAAPAVGAGTGAAIAGATRGNDDLSVIRGIGRDREIVLNEMGIHRYRQVADLDAEQRAEIEGRLGAEPGMIEREHWREQADLLAHGKVEDHRRDYAG